MGILLALIGGTASVSFDNQGGGGGFRIFNLRRKKRVIKPRDLLLDFDPEPEPERVPESQIVTAERTAEDQPSPVVAPLRPLRAVNHSKWIPVPAASRENKPLAKSAAVMAAERIERNNDHALRLLLLAS